MGLKRKLGPCKFSGWHPRLAPGVNPHHHRYLWCSPKSSGLLRQTFSYRHEIAANWPRCIFSDKHITTCWAYELTIGVIFVKPSSGFNSQLVFCDHFLESLRCPFRQARPKLPIVILNIQHDIKADDIDLLTWAFRCFEYILEITLISSGEASPSDRARNVSRLIAAQILSYASHLSYNKRSQLRARPFF